MKTYGISDGVTEIQLEYKGTIGPKKFENMVSGACGAYRYRLNQGRYKKVKFPKTPLEYIADMLRIYYGFEKPEDEDNFCEMVAYIQKPTEDTPLSIKIES